MPSSPTTRNRLEKQGAGESPNTWGAPKLNTVIDLTDVALDGWTTKALTGNVTLTSTNYAADESRPRVLKFTGTGTFQVTIPAVEKWYIVWNVCTGTLTVTTGSGTTVGVETNEIAVLICDGTNVKPLGADGSSLKAYIDAKVLPSQTSHSGKVLGTNGSAASWVPGAAFAFADVFLATTTAGSSIVRGYGVSSILRNAGGDFSVFWTNTPSAVPVVICSTGTDDASAWTTNESAAGVSVLCRLGDGVTARDNITVRLAAFVP